MARCLFLRIDVSVPAVSTNTPIDVDPWGRPTITAPPRLPPWVPADARERIARGLEDGIHVFAGTGGWGQVVVWSERTQGRHHLQLYAEYPESEAFYRGIGIDDDDTCRRLADASRTFNRDLRHLVIGRGMPPEEARQALHQIHDQVFLLTVQAAAALSASPSALALTRSFRSPALPDHPRRAQPSPLAGAPLRISEARQIGGRWAAIDPTPHPAVIAQQNSLSCGPACGAMLLRDRGRIVTQEQVALRSGVPASPSSLERALNALDPSSDGGWTGGLVRIPGRGGKEAAIQLSRSGTWSGILWERGARVGHAVVVDEIDANGLVWIRDPFGKGSRYALDLDVFLDHWTGIAVFRRPQ